MENFEKDYILMELMIIYIQIVAFGLILLIILAIIRLLLLWKPKILEEIVLYEIDMAME